MTSVTLSSKGQLTIPRQLRESLGLTPGTRLMVSVDQDGRLILVPSLYEPEDPFHDRPKVQRPMTLEDMDRTIAAAASRADA